jgi:RNA polymerase sigma factor (sigma-70 family)
MEETVSPGHVDSLTDRAAEAFRDYQEGAGERMGDLVELLTPTLWHVARACRLDRQSAEDVVQLAWMRLVEHAQGIEEAQAIVAWLVTTVRRESWRASKRADRTRPRDMDLELDTGEELLLGPRPSPDPADVAALEDRRQRLWSHVSTLTPRCQQLLRIICFSESPNYAAISEDLGMPVGSIGPTRGRCLATLRKALLNDPHWSAS